MYSRALCTWEQISVLLLLYFSLIMRTKLDPGPLNLQYCEQTCSLCKLKTLNPTVVHLQNRPWSRSPQWSCCRCSSPELSCDTAAASDERLDSCKHLCSDHKTLKISWVAFTCMQWPLHWVHLLINANALGLIFTIISNLTDSWSQVCKHWLL